MVGYDDGLHDHDTTNIQTTNTTAFYAQAAISFAVSFAAVLRGVAEPVVLLAIEWWDGLCTGLSVPPPMSRCEGQAAVRTFCRSCSPARSPAPKTGGDCASISGYITSLCRATWLRPAT